jgi:hypothetical protein
MNTERGGAPKPEITVECVECGAEYNPADEGPEAHEPDDPLHHPKVGAMFKKANSDRSVQWDDRDELLRELDETVLNVLAWSDIPTDVGAGTGGGTTLFIADDHFDAHARDSQATIYPDPMPELEAKQESILVWALGQIAPETSDHDVVEAVAADGGMHREQLAEKTGWSMSTLYRVIDRLDGAIESRNGHFRFASRELKRDFEALLRRVGDFKHHITSRAERLLNAEIRSKSNSSFERFLAKYGAEFVDRGQVQAPVIRIGTVLRKLKSPDLPHIQDVIDELMSAWRNDQRDPDYIRGATLEADLLSEDGYRAIVR